MKNEEILSFVILFFSFFFCCFVCFFSFLSSSSVGNEGMNE